MSDNTETTDFGFRRVPRTDKRGMVRAVFDSVAPRYDLMNDLMSLGVHRASKRVLITALGRSVYCRCWGGSWRGMRPAIATWRRASERFRTGTPWLTCCDRPDLRAWRCATFRGVSQPCIRGGDCERSVRQEGAADRLWWDSGLQGVGADPAIARQRVRRDLRADRWGQAFRHAVVAAGAEREQSVRRPLLADRR